MIYKKCNAWSTNIFNFQVFFNSSCIIHLCRTVDIPVGKVGPNQCSESSVAGTGRDVRDELINKRQRRRRRRRRRRKVFFDQWALKIDEIWWRKSVSELWGHSERTVRKWRRNWRRRSPRQEQKEADIKNHLLHGKFVLFLLFLKLN